MTKMALSLAFSCLSRDFLATICVLLIIQVLKSEGWVLKCTFSAQFLSIAYIAYLVHPYIESLLPCPMISKSIKVSESI